MRRNDKEIRNLAAIEDIIDRSCICHLAVNDNGIPYVLPMCFAYHDRTFSFHSASEGRKIAALRDHPDVCISLVAGYDILRHPKACSWSMRYESVVGFGRVRFIEDPAEKRLTLDRILLRYADGRFFSTDYPEEMLQRTSVFDVSCHTWTAKVSG